MHARGDIGICRLARFLAIAILMCGTTVSAGEIIIHIPDGLYAESAVIYKPEPPESEHGEDVAAPETVVIDTVRTYPTSGHQYALSMGARTLGKGPECHARLAIISTDPGDQVWSATYSSAEARAYTDFNFVVYNSTGTDVELIVPLIAEGTLSVYAFHEEHGTNPVFETRARAHASIEFYDDPSATMPIGGYYSNVYHTDDPIVATEKKPWLLTVPVLVGKNLGDRATFTVVQMALVNGAATAHSNPEHPELKGYSSVVVAAVVDPFIYIDPTWEHAEKFGLAFPDNVTPLTDAWDEVIFADGFEIGCTLLWSENSN